MSFGSKKQNEVNYLHLSYSFSLHVSAYSQPPKTDNNSASVWPINNSVPKKSAVQSNNPVGTGGAYPPSVMLNVYIHNCVPSVCPWGIRERCCGELERAGTGRCRSVEAAAELRLEAGTSRWWPAPGHSEPAGRSLAPRSGPAWQRRTASYPILPTPESLLSSVGTKKWRSKMNEGLPS